MWLAEVSAAARAESIREQLLFDKAGNGGTETTTQADFPSRFVGVGLPMSYGSGNEAALQVGRYFVSIHGEGTREEPGLAYRIMFSLGPAAMARRRWLMIAETDVIQSTVIYGTPGSYWDI